MKQKRLAPILAVTLSLEMMLSPVLAFAQTDGSSTAAKVNNIAETTSSLIKAAGTIYNSVNMNRQAMGMDPNLTALQQLQAPKEDQYFKPAFLLQIPGLANYLALNRINPEMLNCKTLQTTIHKLEPEACRIGITQDSVMPGQAQLEQMKQYNLAYSTLSNQYQNYSVDSNTGGQLFGVGCMNNAMNILNGFFKYRLDELDKLTTNLEAMQNAFREASKSDLDAIEETVAVLDGDSPLADKVRSKKPDLFDFSKRFNNAACNSMFGGDTLNDLGRARGLNAINKNIKDTLGSKDRDSKYSGESYAQSHSAVVEDITSTIDKVGKQIELNFNSKGSSPQGYNDFLKGIPGLISSTTGIQESIRMDSFSDLQSKYTEQITKINEEKALIQSELGNGAERAFNQLGALKSSSFEAEVNSIENGIKNQCLSTSLGDTSKLLDKIYDPSSSKHANKYASNFLKDKITQILGNPSTSVEKKLAELKAVESQEGNRYYMKMENSYEVQDVDASGNLTTKVMEANVRRSPSVFFSDIINNCNAQFKANKLGNKLTGAGAVQKLRQLGQNFRNLAKTQATDAKKELRKKLIECASPEIANNTVAGSCTPSLFNTRSPGFCASAAFSCSKNMQACSKQAEGYVKEIRDQKTARVNNYKTLLEKNKQDIVKMFDTALSQYMKDGEALRGLFGAGFSSPRGIKREVPAHERYLDSFMQATGKQGSPDGKLLLEDPDKYVEMFTANVDQLKKSVQEQQDQILGGNSVSGKKDGLLASHIEKTKKNYKDAIAQADKIANQCLASHDNVVRETQNYNKKMQEEQMKTNQELGEKLPRFCSSFKTAKNDANGACGSDVSDLVKSAYKAATQIRNSSDLSAINEFERVCNSINSNTSGKDSGSVPSDDKMCAELAAADGNKGETKSQASALKGYRLYCNRIETNNCTLIKKVVNGETTETRDCTDEREQLYKLYRESVQKTSLTVSATTSDPSFCSAGDNSNRSSGKDFNNSLEAFTNQLMGRTH